MKLEWEDKLALLNLLTEHVLCMRAPGDWYVSSQSLVEIGGDGFLTSTCGDGTTPEEAVDDWFDTLSSLSFPRYVLVGGMDGKAYRWSGHGWKDVTSEREELAKRK